MILHGRTGTQVKVTTAEVQSSNATTLAGLMECCEKKCDHLLSAQILGSAE